MKTSQSRLALGAIALVGLVIAANCAARPTQVGEATPDQLEPTTEEPRGSDGVDVGYLASDRPRDTAPQLEADDLAALAAGNSDFAFDLYQALRGQEGNLFYSPHSLSTALAMTYAGARGETERQMAETLHFTLTNERLHPAFNALDLALASRGEGVEEGEGQGFKLHIANALWGQDGYHFLPEFLDLLAENYGAGMRLLDFAGDPEASRQTINAWVSDQTEAKIQDLIPQGAIDTLTRLVLANAIYFNASWSYPFEEAQTREGDFHLLDGGQASVPMMSQLKAFGYARSEGVQAVELPYVGDELVMDVFLPDEGQFEAFESSLDTARARRILDGLEVRSLSLSMPRFEFESTLGLSETLAAMGMADAVSPEAADFSGMDGSRDLFISAILHKAFVSVDEEGTEAAAATAVVVGITSVIEPEVEVTLDRPFIFLIRDLETDAVLFLGRVLNPAQ